MLKGGRNLDVFFTAVSNVTHLPQNFFGPDAVCDTAVLVTCHKNKCVCTLEKPGYLFKEGYCFQIDQGEGKKKKKTKQNNNP